MRGSECHTIKLMTDSILWYIVSLFKDFLSLVLGCASNQPMIASSLAQCWSEYAEETVIRAIIAMWKGVVEDKWSP